MSSVPLLVLFANLSGGGPVQTTSRRNALSFPSRTDDLCAELAIGRGGFATRADAERWAREEHAAQHADGNWSGVTSL